jgi:hypothetical protein
VVESLGDYTTISGTGYKMNAKILNEKMEEIEKLQDKVDYILYNKNPFVRFFFHRKAHRLHLEAEKKIRELFLFPLDKMNK